MEKSNDVEPGPSREELRQVVRSKPTGEFVSPNIAEQVAKKVKDDERVAEVRKSLGLDPELSDRRGETASRVTAIREDDEAQNGFGQTVRGPRSEYANRERGRIDWANDVRKQIDFANIVGASVEDIEIPDKDSEGFEGQLSVVQDKVTRALDKRFQEFGHGMANSFMSGFIAKYKAADSEAGAIKIPDESWKAYTGTSKARLSSGDRAKIENVQAIRAKQEDIGKQILYLMRQRLETAGWNNGPEKYRTTSEATNLGRANEIMGTNL